MHATAGAPSSSSHHRAQRRPINGHACSSSELTFPVSSRFRPDLSFRPPPLSKPATIMSPGGGHAGGDRDKNPPPQGVHPRYIPKRGAVLKGIVRGVLRRLLLASSLVSGPANSAGCRVRPAPAEAAGDGAAGPSIRRRNLSDVAGPPI